MRAKRRRVRLAALVAVAAVVTTACGRGGATSSSSSSRQDATPRGGTLRIAAPNLVAAPPPQGTSSAAVLLDPQELAGPEGAELDSCCLTRTLVAHRGAPTAQGGAVLLPDLAAALPEVSADGLSWTFHLRAGLHYGPPLQTVEITTPDIVRGLERAAKLQQAGPFYNVIQGFDAYSYAKADTIAGLETPDAHTLVVRLTTPTGDLGERFSIPAASPIPPLPGHHEAALGVATGHDDGDSAFLVSTGPYMLAGSDALDFSQPAAQQRGATGFDPAHQFTLVRNPSWSQGDDDIRPAYVDRIEVVPGGDVDSAAAALDGGQVDVVMIGQPAPQAPPQQIAAYQSDPRRGRVEVDARDALRSVEMNLAIAPFDDVHVRRAVNYVLDKAKILAAYGGGINARSIGHVVIDSLEGNALLNYDPFHTASADAALAAASGEMRQSAYDTNRDGSCGAAVCKRVDTLVIPRPAFQAMARSISADLAVIGIVLDPHTPRSVDGFFNQYLDPKQHTIAMAIMVGWAKDFFSPEDYFHGQFAAGAPGIMNLGQTPDQLRARGYAVTSVPAIDDRISECSRLTGSEAGRCWSELDQYVTERIAPAVPMFDENYVAVVPRRVVRYSFDQYWDMPAPDEIAVQR